MTIFQNIGQELSCWSTSYKTIRRNLQGKKFESEVFLLEKFVSAGAICLDIGAAYGRYAFQLSQLAGAQGHVYCFEPGTYSYNVIKKAIWFHRLKNVTLIKKALAESAGTASMTIPIKQGHKLGPSLAHLSTENAEQGVIQDSVSLTTVDQFCAEKRITRLDLIKCDVEGAEMKVFRGAARTIERFKPVVLSEVEDEHLKKFGFTRTQIFDFFRQQGYLSYVCQNNALHKVENPSADHNYFFIHKTKTF